MLGDVSAPRGEWSVGQRTPVGHSGARFGRYQLLRRLAVGGMAELYLARQVGIEGFEKFVVLKKILPQHESKPDFVRMFLDEARLAASLSHPNIAQVYDIGTVSGSYFFAMEYVHGKDVREILQEMTRRGRRPSLVQALSIVVAAAAGLHYAHERRGPDGRLLGIVHRDVSPANVLVAFDGSVKIIDFGIAKAALRANETKAGTLKGKIAYMSPEQVRGEPVDRRCDVFALGIMLYELTTGVRPFDGESELAVLNRITQLDPTPPSALGPYPAELERIVMRALAKDPRSRFGTAQELQVALEELARERKWPLSSVGLARMMRTLFPERSESATWLASDRARVDRSRVDGRVIESKRLPSLSDLAEDVGLGDLDAETTSSDEAARARTPGFLSSLLRDPRRGRRGRALTTLLSGTALTLALVLLRWPWRSSPKEGSPQMMPAAPSASLAPSAASPASSGPSAASPASSGPSAASPASSGPSAAPSGPPASSAASPAPRLAPATRVKKSRGDALRVRWDPDSALPP